MITLKHVNAGRNRTSLFLCLGTGILTLMLSGCITMEFEFGSIPLVDRLSSLRPGISDQSDVLLTLGEPRGHGVAHFSPETTPRQIWFYEHTASDGTTSKIKFLLVLFDRNIYDGYFWFFSGATAETDYTTSGQVIRITPTP